jgi:hypothetical protein
MEASRIYRFFRQHPQGYNYVKYFYIEERESLDGSPKNILIKKTLEALYSTCLLFSM